MSHSEKCVWMRGTYGLHGEARIVGGYTWKEELVSVEEALRQACKDGLARFDVVLLTTGEVLRRPHRTPLPGWLSHELTRQMVLASGQLPPSSKK